MRAWCYRNPNAVLVFWFVVSVSLFIKAAGAARNQVWVALVWYGALWFVSNLQMWKWWDRT